MYNKMRVLLSLFCCLCCSNGLRILSIFPFPSHSHYTVGFILMKQLAERGHNITFVAPYKEKEPIENFKTILMTGVVQEWEEFTKKQSPISHHQRSPFATIFFLDFMASTIVEKTLSNENMQKLLKSDEEFDIVLVENFANEALFAIANHFSTPSVLISSIGPSALSNYMFGNPDIPSYMANVLLEPPVHTSFFKRTYNFALYIFQRLYFHFYHLPNQNEILHKYLPNAPHVNDVVYNISLIFHNSDESYSQPLPMLPNMINIGGYHVETPKKLPGDLQSTLDNAKNGIIFFSMGSIIKSKTMPEALRRDILYVFSKLKETILWKLEEDLPEKPSNVVIRKWFPQADILAHPNLKLFITHGGLLSTIEALDRGVPVIGIPIFGDQKMNMMNAVNRGTGLMIPYSELSKERLSETINEMLHNSKYSQNAKYSSKILQDSLVKPIDKVEFWLEYVVRYKGAKHLRSAALDLNWYQHASVDVIMFLTAITIVLFLIFYTIIRRLFRRNGTLKIKSN